MYKTVGSRHVPHCLTTTGILRQEEDGDEADEEVNGLSGCMSQEPARNGTRESLEGKAVHHPNS